MRSSSVHGYEGVSGDCMMCLLEGSALNYFILVMYIIYYILYILYIYIIYIYIYRVG